jgi:hypothetical protein
VALTNPVIQVILSPRQEMTTMSKKATKKKKVTKKATKKAPSAAPKKEAKATKKAPAKRKRVWLSVMVAAADLTPSAKKLISAADSLEVQIADAQDHLKDKLALLKEAIGGATFEHPSRGPMTIMDRGDKTFWRTKPAGVQAA